MGVNRPFSQFRWIFIAFAIIGFIGASTFIFTNAFGLPNLSKIVYSSGGLIYVIEGDGKNERQITKPPEDPTGWRSDRQPSCSPDGKRIAFRATRTALQRDIWVIDVDGRNLKNLTDSPEDEHYPAWSPDGKKIAFTRGGFLRDSDIWVMDADDRNQKNLTNSPETEKTERHPTWSPDGKKIAFENPPTGIWVMDADGKNQKYLTTGYSPSWSPDGKKIAFTLDGIWVIDTEGKKPKRLTSAPDAEPSWSPDGSKIAFRRLISPKVFIYVMDADGGNLKELTDGMEPCWLVPRSASLDQLKAWKTTWSNIKRGL